MARNSSESMESGTSASFLNFQPRRTSSCPAARRAGAQCQLGLQLPRSGFQAVPRDTELSKADKTVLSALAPLSMQRGVLISARCGLLHAPYSTFTAVTSLQLVCLSCPEAAHAGPAGPTNVALTCAIAGLPHRAHAPRGAARLRMQRRRAVHRGQRGWRRRGAAHPAVHTPGTLSHAVLPCPRGCLTCACGGGNSRHSPCTWPLAAHPPLQPRRC